MTVYATAEDYQTYTGASSAPSDITVLLRSASDLVTENTITSRYRVDTDGVPLDDAVTGALRDATCAQAAAWNALNVDPLAGGVVTPGVKQSKGIGSASVTYADASAAGAARASAVSGLVPSAVRILRNAGLLSSAVWELG